METLNRNSQNLPNRLSVALLGYPKSGKSTIALSFPKPISILHVDLNHEPAYSTLASGAHIELNYPDPELHKGWKDIHEWWLRARNREIDAQTLVVDSFGVLQKNYISPRFQEPDGGISQKGWGQILNQSMAFAIGLNSTTRQMAGKPSYNLVVVCHLSEKKDKEGNTVAERPDIQGSFANVFAAGYATTLYCRSTVRNVEVGVGDKKHVEKIESYTVHRVAPNAAIDTECGDSFGGQHGRKRLPLVLEDGTYPNLCRAWGIEPDPDLETVFPNSRPSPPRATALAK